MKPRTLIFVGLTVLLTAPIALAGTLFGSPAETVDLGLVTLPRAEFERLQAVVDGHQSSHPTSAAEPAAMVTMGLAEMTAEETAALRQMVAGDYTGGETRASNSVDKEVHLGLVSMPNSEYQALRGMVRVQNNAGCFLNAFNNGVLGASR